jgi:hypothetical protein
MFFPKQLRTRMPSRILGVFSSSATDRWATRAVWPKAREFRNEWSEWELNLGGRMRVERIVPQRHKLSVVSSVNVELRHEYVFSVFTFDTLDS